MSPTSTVGVGFGANLANDGPPDLPTQERTEDLEAWRARMDARREEARGHRDVIQAGVSAEAAVTVRPRPVVKPRPPVVRAARVDPKTQQRAAVVTAYLAGDSTLVLAARYGVTATTIGNWLKAAEVTLRPPGGPRRRAVAPEPEAEPAPAPEPPALAPVVVADPVPVAVVTSGSRYVDAAEAAAIVAAYAAGQTAVEIAAAHHRNPGTVRKALRKAGVQLRDERSTRSGGRVKVDDQAVVDAVRRLYVDEALTQAQVADRLGMGTHAVQKLMGRNGIESRPDVTGVTVAARPPAPRTVRYFPSDTTPPADELAALEALTAANPAIGRAIDPAAWLVAVAAEPDPLTIAAGVWDPAAMVPVPRACRVCGCTDDRACEGGCWWVEVGLCSACEAQTPSPVGDGVVDAVLGVPVLDVATALADVVTATEQLLDAQRAVALMRVRALHRLAAELLLVLDHPPTTTGV